MKCTHFLTIPNFQINWDWTKKGKIKKIVWSTQGREKRELNQSGGAPDIYQNEETRLSGCGKRGKQSETRLDLKDVIVAKSTTVKMNNRFHLNGEISSHERISWNSRKNDGSFSSLWSKGSDICSCLEQDWWIYLRQETLTLAEKTLENKLKWEYPFGSIKSTSPVLQSLNCYLRSNLRWQPCLLVPEWLNTAFVSVPLPPFSFLSPFQISPQKSNI